MNIKGFFKTAAIMATFAGIAALLLHLTYQLASPVLSAQAQERLLSELNALIPAQAYNNDLAQDIAYFSVAELDAKKPIVVYRARKDQQPVASLLQVTAPNGYNGAIQLLVGVWADGRLAGIKVLAHKETPGLGDYIEDKRSNWSQQFIGKSLKEPSIARWKVKKDGGVFSYNTGATITPRAIIATVARTLTWVEQQGNQLYDIAGNKP